MKGFFNSNGVWCDKDEDIESIFANYLSDIFTSSNPSCMNLQDVLQCINPIVSDECNHALLKPYSKDEIYAALQ